MAQSKEKISKALIIGIKNEIRVIELYSQYVKRDASSESKKEVKNLIKDEERHAKLLKEAFEKTLDKKLNTSKIKDDSLKAVEIVKNDPSYLHIIDIAIGYEKREKAHFEKSEKEISDKELKELFNTLAKEEQGHIEVLEHERKAALGLPYDEYELDLYVRE